MPSPTDDACAVSDGMVRVYGARENNLRDVDLEVPRGAVVAFTGVSGSGKSSLAFGTLYAESQRRFLESVAPYARRLIQQGHHPQVDRIDGLPPAVALQQRRGTASTRSTVGTVTTLSNSLRMLFSRAGTYPEGVEVLDSDAFSPNTPAGACPQCHGLGEAHTVDTASLVPDPTLTIREGAIAAWPGAWQGKSLLDMLVHLGYSIDTPWEQLDATDRDWILLTEERPVVEVVPFREHNARPYKGTYISARSHVKHVVANSKSESARRKAMDFMRTEPCPACAGSGLRAAALDVQFSGRTIAELSALPLEDLIDILRPTAGLERADSATRRHRTGERTDVAVQLCRDLVGRIEVLLRLGLGYVGLDRTTPTLSAGELQRLRIATQLRSGLFGVVYVLDEPSAGLHPADAEALLEVLDELKAAGNTVYVVEHHRQIIAAADWIVDVGPGAGEHGGRVIYSGPPEGLVDVAESVTGPYLAGRVAPRLSAEREPTGWIELTALQRHNLDGVNARFPLGVLTAVTGVSGAGKSTLVDELAARSGMDRVITVDQKPIGRTPRSNVATYTGLFDAVRRAFADTDDAAARGFGAGRFSFNVAGGRCETCQGEGFVAVELVFLPGSYGPCPDCGGSRYEPETLEVRYRGKTIAEVLELTVDAAAEFLADLPAASRSLETLRRVGLGYLRLGQPATEVSGGEAQRIKLASELQRRRRGGTLYLLDEPTTGLHPADTDVLLRQLHALVEAGDTVVVVEHDMEVVAGADWVIDLGPAGGSAGGHIVAEGRPAEVARAARGATASYLRVALGHEA
ncbi:excinuclease ABC subunit A [Zhihengliuella flava]|uniref:UvrABC system protein A n=1 Tax=Zhihengliuella flava TaxID=1285193 RepID=A0A931DBE8_9MICC|nr:excinuclease ABC subunit A [Zhihengliuella flava]